VVKTKIILTVVLLILLAILLIQNTALVTFHVLFWTISMSQVVLVPLAALAGFLIGLIVGTLRRRRTKANP
jgi:uncharacterized integral membrane protein